MMMVIVKTDKNFPQIHTIWRAERMEEEGAHSSSFRQRSGKTKMDGGALKLW